MKLFIVKLAPHVQKSLKPMQVAVDSNMISIMAQILEESPSVLAFGAENIQIPGSKKFSSHLTMQNTEADSDHNVKQSIMDAIDRINNERIEKYAGCYVDSFIGGPGDYSPPDCNCPKCIASGRAYEYNSYEVTPSPQMLEYFYTLLVGMKETKRMRSGIEYILPAQCRITIYKQGCMTICSNKPEIRIGVYVWNHAEKAWRSAQ